MAMECCEHYSKSVNLHAKSAFIWERARGSIPVPNTEVPLDTSCMIAFDEALCIKQELMTSYPSLYRAYI